MHLRSDDLADGKVNEGVNRAYFIDWHGSGQGQGQWCQVSLYILAFDLFSFFQVRGSDFIQYQCYLEVYLVLQVLIGLRSTFVLRYCTFSSPFTRGTKTLYCQRVVVHQNEWLGRLLQVPVQVLADL